MRTDGDATGTVNREDAAEFATDLLGNLADIARKAGLTQSALALGLTAEFIRMEAGQASMDGRNRSKSASNAVQAERT